MRVANPKKAFTLIELLVVVSIISLLVSILLPALGKAREQARTALCASNQRQLMMAQIYYAEDYGVYAVQNKEGAPVVHFLSRYLNGAAMYQSGWSPTPVGGVLNEAPYICPTTGGPAVKRAEPTQANWYDGGMRFPFGWNVELGFWYTGSQYTKPARPYLAPSRIRRPAGVLGWADTQNIPTAFSPHWTRYYSWAPAPTLRHGSNKSFCNVIFVDGHYEMVGWDRLSDQATYTP